MTLIIKSGPNLYSDSTGTYGTSQIKVRKLFDCGRFAVGGAGNGSSLMVFVNWIKSGRKAEKWPFTEELDIEQDLEAICYDRETGETLFYTVDCPYAIVVLSDPFCVGSGSAQAEILLKRGVSPEDTITEVAQSNYTVGLPVQKLDLTITKKSKKRSK